MSQATTHITGRLEYDSRRNRILLGRVPLRTSEVDQLTTDERSALLRLKAHPVQAKSAFGDDRWHLAI